jgi:predicted nucleotidyltransferase
MSEVTDDCFDAIEATLRKAVAALERRRVPFLLGGSLAVWARGGPESCNDLDLMVRSEYADAALEALEDAGMRGERPPEGWLFKAWDGRVLVDLIFGPKGLPIDDATFDRSEAVSVFGLEVRAMSLEDVLITKLRALHEHYLDYDPLLQMTRAVRERIDWDRVRQETVDSPYARAFFTLAEELELIAPARQRAPAEGRPRIRLANG